MFAVQLKNVCILCPVFGTLNKFHFAVHLLSEVATKPQAKLIYLFYQKLISLVSFNNIQERKANLVALEHFPSQQNYRISSTKSCPSIYPPPPFVELFEIIGSFD